MRIRIVFDKNGRSISTAQDGSLYEIREVVTGTKKTHVKVDKENDPDIYDVAESPTGRYVKEGVSVRPMTAQEIFDAKSYTAKRLTEYHSPAEIIDSILKTFHKIPELMSLIEGTELEERVSHHQAVKAKYPKP